MHDSNQTAYGIEVIRTPAEARVLLSRLSESPEPIGVDTETIGCNPAKESPVGTARIFCWSVAWVERGSTRKHSRRDIPLARRAFIPNWGVYDETLLPLFREWLEDPNAPKVLHNGYTFDSHVFANHGINLRGVAADTLRVSKLWRCVSDGGHGLNLLAETCLGYEMRDYKELASRFKRLTPHEYRPTRSHTPTSGPLMGIPTLTCKGMVDRISAAYTTEEMPLDVLVKEYPQRIPKLIDYASLDAKCTLELWLLQRQSLATKPKLEAFHRDVWNPSLEAISAVERRGIGIDSGYMREQETKATEALEACEKVLTELTGKHEMNWASYPQLSAWLYDECKLPNPPIKGTLKAVKRAKDGDRPTGEASLYWLELNGSEDPSILQALAELRRRRKLYRFRGYLRDIPTMAIQGRVHCVLAPETETGRLSAKLPPLQQIPSDDPFGIRRGFIPSPGHKFIVSDYSQLEVYVMAHHLVELFGDHSLADALATGDVYGAIAKLCWPEKLEGINPTAIKHHPDPEISATRKLAKIVVLATNYGKTEEGLAYTLLDETGNPSTAQRASDLLESYQRAFPGVERFAAHQVQLAQSTGYVRSLLGRQRPLAECRSNRQWERESGGRKARNTPIQAGAADIMTLALLGIHRDERLADMGCVPAMQVHDELILEVPEHCAEEAREIVIDKMENPGVELNVPLKVEANVCDNWAGGKG